MTKLLAVLFVGLLLEAAGVVQLSRGLKELGEPARLALPELVRFVGKALTNRQIVSGVALEAGFFGCLLYLMSRADVSFIWPLTALSFVATTLAARFWLHEQVSGLRWFGVALILAGAAVITYTEKARRPREAAQPPAATGPVNTSGNTTPVR